MNIIIILKMLTIIVLHHRWRRLLYLLHRSHWWRCYCSHQCTFPANRHQHQWTRQHCCDGDGWGRMVRRAGGWRGGLRSSDVGWCTERNWPTQQNLAAGLNTPIILAWWRHGVFTPITMAWWCDHAKTLSWRRDHTKKLAWLCQNNGMMVWRSRQKSFLSK